MAVTRDEVVDLASRGGAAEHIGRCSGEWNRAGCDGTGIQVSVNIWGKGRGSRDLPRLSLVFHMPSMIYISLKDQKIEGSMILEGANKSELRAEGQGSRALSRHLSRRSIGFSPN
jgi:hypothetical protein